MTKRGLSGKKNSMGAWESELRTSQAERGYLNLRKFELVASLAIVIGPNLGDIVDEGGVFIVLHAS